MVPEIISLIAFLVENCTGVALAETLERHSEQQDDLLQECLPDVQQSNKLEDFTSFDPNDTIFQEFDPPEYLEADPKAWKTNLPTFCKSFFECLKNVLLIQTVAGTVIGCLAVVIIFFDYSTVQWCYDENSSWNKMPIDVQRLRVTAQTVEGLIIQLWDFSTIILVFPLSLIKDLHLLTLNLLASFIDASYKLYFQMYGIYKISWMSFPLNALFFIMILVNNYLLARHFYPRSVKKAMKLDFIFSAQFLFGVLVTLIFVYILLPWFSAQGKHEQVILAAMCPIVTVIPKLICRLSAQKLHGIVHPGIAHVFVAVMYGSSAIVLRVLQVELHGVGWFAILGVGHAIIGLLERITVTMRDHIWEYLYRLVRRQRSHRQPKYRSPRSRRFIADVSIQIMMQESTALISALGVNHVYQFMYRKSKHYPHLISTFLVRAGIALFIDLVFNTISLLIQTRVMNVAVNRVWKKKWRHHMLVNAVLTCVSTFYFSGHLFEVVRDKYEHKIPLHLNCSLPDFL